eukprot:PhF_6_TR25463/c0_g1_i2/m.35292
MSGDLYDGFDTQIATFIRVETEPMFDEKTEDTAQGKKMCHIQIMCPDREGSAMTKVLQVLRAITFTTKSPIVATRNVVVTFRVDFESLEGTGPLVGPLSPTQIGQPASRETSRGLRRYGSMTRKKGTTAKIIAARYDTFEARCILAIQVVVPILRVPVGMQI